ncbi:P2Y purinoceptor 13-like [Pagrus major]|uniref:P2Y purinoceptor 13-like n=1 Tax=Pagrus major TaxID=143350 RepID=UPI003CC8A3B3
MTLTLPVKGAGNLENVSKTIYIISCYVSPIFYSTLYTCITLLGVISLDRFFKITTPQSKLFGNLTFGKVVSCSVWVIHFGSGAIPNIILSNRSVANLTTITTCMNLKGPAGLDFHESVVIYLNVFFWLVSLVVAVCYICITHKVIQSFRNSGSNNNQGKQKIKLRVFLIVIVFFVSFGPYHIVRIPYTFQQVALSSHNSCFYITGRLAKEVSLWFAATNICMNPLLYVFLCREFKEKLTSMTQNGPVSFLAASAEKAEVASTQSRV